MLHSILIKPKLSDFNEIREFFVFLSSEFFTCLADEGEVSEKFFRRTLHFEFFKAVNFKIVLLNYKEIPGKNSIFKFQ